MEKPQLQNQKGVGLISAKHNLFSPLGHPAVTSAGLPTPAILGFRDRGQPSISSHQGISVR
jgi:hypothetical protein